jgi:hypothetical protein
VQGADVYSLTKLYLYAAPTNPHLPARRDNH